MRVFEGPFVWFLGWAMIIAVIAGFIITITAIVHGPDDMQKCLASGGSWSHTLSQKDTRDTSAQYDDKCTIGVRP